MYRKYNQNIPQFLVNRPRHLVVHCMERWEVAKNIPKSHITIIDDVTGEFKVKSQLEQTVRYNLQFGDPSSMPKCECPDWLQTFLPCKHFLAIFHHLPAWQWDSLPTSYRESPLLLLDDDVMKERPHAAVTQANDNNHEDENCNNQDMGQLAESSTEEHVLPLQQPGKQPRNQATKCREVLQQLRNLSFLVHDPEALALLHTTLCKALIDLQQFVPKEDGILLEAPKANSRKRSATPLPCTQKTSNPLPCKKAKKNKFSGRVGEVANTMKKTYNISSTLEEITATNQKMAHIPYGDAGLPVDVGQSNTSAADDYKSAFQEDKEVEGILGQVELEMSSDCDTTDTQKHEHQNKEMTGQEINSDNSKDETCDSHAEDDDIVITGEGTCRVQKHKNRVMCEDEFNIIKTGQMLTDTSINVAQNFLHNQFPYVDGLEDTVLGPTFQFSIAGGEFVQVLHDGGLHWICVSNIGCAKGVVKCFDSYNNRGYIKKYVGKQVASIIRELSPQLTVRITAVQQQQNGTDCGVFALAYATSLLHGQDPESVTYDTSKLRSHLLHCLHQGHMSPFPLTETKHDRCKTKDVALILYCSCRMPWQKADDSDPAMQMAQCDNCLEWFHRCCENIPDNVFVNNSFWECYKCHKKG